MSSFFEQELRKLFGDGTVIQAPQFVGRSCLGTLGNDLRVRAQFITMGHADHYEALRLTVMNRTEGDVDKIVLRLRDVIGIKPVPNNPNFPNGVSPHIWTGYGKAEWYAFRPTEADYRAIRQAAAQYLDVFRERTEERVQDGPQMVYICAPLRGEVEKNIEFARQKAKEVFQEGDIPVCPHLMFPPISDPTNPVEDKAAMEMGLKLLEKCQQLNVYGPVWTDGMWGEIHHAERLGIPIMTDQKTLGRTPPKKKTPQRGR
jgi:hypothetical protein